MDNKLITIGIPCYKAHNTLRRTLASIQIQSVIDKIKVILINDNPCDEYWDIIKSYPELNILYIQGDKNLGPGLARQRALDECETKYITFIDADDILFDGYSIEKLLLGITKTPNCIECQGTFYQECTNENGEHTFIKKDDFSSPWVFGRLYDVNFLRTNDIKFSSLRSMEDGEFNWKIRMTIEGSRNTVNVIKEPVYVWKEGSEHSITRIGIDDKGIPLYNYGNCMLGSTQASINAIKFCRNKNPFNGSITKFTTEMMINQYFSYIECLGRKPVFSEQNLWNAKRFYNECFKEIENQISDEILKHMYTVILSRKANSLIGIIPEITFHDFMELIRTSEYKFEEIYEIREKLPKDIIEKETESGSVDSYFVGNK